MIDCLMLVAMMEVRQDKTPADKTKRLNSFYSNEKLAEKDVSKSWKTIFANTI